MDDIKAINTSFVDLTDESFDIKKSNTYHLSIALGNTSLAYTILDTTTNKYLTLFFYPDLEKETSLGFLQKITASFRTVTCSVIHPKFSLVPNTLFDDDNKASLLGFNHPLVGDEKIHSDPLRTLEARNLFTLSRKFETDIRNLFATTRFMHSATSFIEGLLAQNKNNNEKKVFANFHRGYFEIAILQGGDLLFSNAFQYKTPEEIAYFILFVYEQLHLNSEKTELVLSGEIEKTAKEHSLLYNYIRHVKFASRPDSFIYSYKMDEVPYHKFTSLFNQYLCA